jgi:hypothetical protein
MDQAGSVLSTPPTNTPTDPTRRRFLCQTGAAVLVAIPPSAGAPALGGPVDPSYTIIDAHRAPRLAHSAALVEQNRLEELGDRFAGRVAEQPCFDECDAFDRLMGTAPMTVAGLSAWVAYLDDLRRADAWMFEDLPTASTTLIATFATALQNVAVAS